jgi:ribosomal protein S18 acetylase RimI-like enzyme
MVVTSIGWNAMATKHPKSAQTGDKGIAFVRSVISQVTALCREFNSSDVGIDAAIELLTDARESSGDFVLAQIKAGKSYIKNGQFFVRADRDHFETWSRYSVPVIGIVFNPDNNEARWVDISEYLLQNPEIVNQGPYTIEAPATNPFSVAGFPKLLNRFRRSPATATTTTTPPNLLIRAWRANDAKPTRALLSTIAPDYPGFDKWLTRKFSDSKASKKVVVVGKAVAAFSMWQEKDERNVKLQTFIVGPRFRGTSIGPHLLYHELCTLARNPKLQRIFVTVASSKPELIAYFRAFGFRVEGVAAHRYPRRAAELIMTKHFVRRIVYTPADLDSLAKMLATVIWGLTDAASSRFGVTASDLALPASLPKLSLTLDDSETTVIPRIVLAQKSGRKLLIHDDESLMREFFPLRIHLANKRYVIIPIYRVWVDGMLSSTGRHSPLKLRTDHVYYCYPKIPKLLKGDLVLFYETKANDGRGAAIGSAVVQEVLIDKPEKLFRRFARLGIYQLADVEKHANVQGNAMAIKFALFEHFSAPVILARIRAVLQNSATMQGLTPIKRGAFEIIRTEGLQ